MTETTNSNTNANAKTGCTFHTGDNAANDNDNDNTGTSNNMQTTLEQQNPFGLLPEGFVRWSDAGKPLGQNDEELTGLTKTEWETAVAKQQAETDDAAAANITA